MHSNRPAEPASSGGKGRWERLDQAAFGILYGSITVLALLLALAKHPESGVAMAVILFGSVIAITAAKAFSDVVSSSISNGVRINRAALRDAWHHAKPTLIAANLPTLLFLAAGFGLGTIGTAVTIAQIYSVALLMLVGGRAAWLLDRSLLYVTLGALFTGSVGAALAGLKYLLH